MRALQHRLQKWGVKREDWGCCCESRSRCRRRRFGTRTLPSSLPVPLLQLFLPQLSTELLPTLPSLKPCWFRQPVSSPPFHVSFAYICIAHRFLGGEEELERHSLYSFYFFPPLSRIAFIYLNRVLLLRGARSSPGPADGAVGMGLLIFWVTQKVSSRCTQTPSWQICHSLGLTSKKAAPRWRHCCSKWCPPCPQPVWHLAALEPGVFWGW